MRGFLSFLILWMLKDSSLTGSELADELEKRKGSRPSPGTIYPALKDLKEKGLIGSDSSKKYSLTSLGEKELRESCSLFCQIFYDASEIFTSCKCEK